MEKKNGVYQVPIEVNVARMYFILVNIFQYSKWRKNRMQKMSTPLSPPCFDFYATRDKIRAGRST